MPIKGSERTQHCLTRYFCYADAGAEEQGTTIQKIERKRKDRGAGGLRN